MRNDFFVKEKLKLIHVCDAVCGDVNADVEFGRCGKGVDGGRGSDDCAHAALPPLYCKLFVRSNLRLFYCDPPGCDRESMPRSIPTIPRLCTTCITHRVH